MFINIIALPKLSQIDAITAIEKEIYLKSQDNLTIDPLWVGVPVFFNNGSFDYIKSKNGRHGSIQSIEDIELIGGLDGRIGIVTDFHDQAEQDMMRSIYGSRISSEPWVRISSFLMASIHKYGDYELDLLSSVSIDARLCTTIPMEFYKKAFDFSVKNRFKKNVLGGDIFNQ